MYYLLYRESWEEVYSEDFILFQTDAEGDLKDRFIREHFSKDYEILAAFPIYTKMKDNVPTVSFSKEEIAYHFEQKALNELEEKEYTEKRSEFLSAVNSLRKELKGKISDLEKEMNQAIYQYEDPDVVTKEFIREMREKGFVRSKSKDGKTRFRHMNHTNIRDEYGIKMKEIEKELKVAENHWNAKYYAFTQVHPRKTFNLIPNYSRTSA